MNADRAGVRLTLHRERTSTPVDWSTVGNLDWDDFALVLGAGGATGAAFEAGVLFGLATDFHVTLADARSVTGTSAGSIGASLIALGFDGNDVAAVVAEVYEHVSPTVAALGVRFDAAVPPLPNPFGLLRLPTMRSCVTRVRQLARRQWTALMLSSLRDGTFDMTDRLRFLEGFDWPAASHDIRICAVEAPTGRRRVFTRDSGVSLFDAVCASCAVPAVMRPVTIDGVHHVDGGVASPTNADLVAGDASMAVVVSPMSGTRSRTSAGKLTSFHARQKLAAEVAALQRHHTVLVVEPTADLSVRVVDDALDPTGNRGIMVDTFFAVTARDLVGQV